LLGASVAPKGLVYQARNGQRLAVASIGPWQALACHGLARVGLHDLGLIDTSRIDATLPPNAGNNFHRSRFPKKNKIGAGWIAMNRGIES
jgi:hypothetical protein